VNRPAIHRHDPQRDLVLERVVDVPVPLVWRAWTVPEHLMRWFTPLPWRTVECEIDLVPGGIFRTVMRSPEGQDTPHVGCYLEVVENERLVWTTALLPGFRPAPPTPPEGDPCGVDPFTAVIAMAPHGSGTRYTATAMHGDAAGRKRHEDLGFHDGWGTALDQLVALARTL
jgi:uncharacterized protein YndB with AHSA1/START domain